MPRVTVSASLVPELESAMSAVKARPRQFSPQAVRNLAMLIAVGKGRTLEDAAANMVTKQFVSMLVRRVVTEGVESVIKVQKPGRKSQLDAVSALLASGLSPAETAARLDVSMATVNRARRREAQVSPQS